MMATTGRRQMRICPRMTGDGSLCKLVNPAPRIDTGIVGLPTAVPEVANTDSTDDVYQAQCSREGYEGDILSSGIAAIIGAAIGAIATAAGVIVQAMLKNRADAQQRREARQSDRERQRRELVQRYLLQLQDAVVSLRLRLVNWAQRGGQALSESVDPGYWDVTTLYALGRALAAECILSLEGVYAAIEQRFPGQAESLRHPSVDGVLQVGLRRLFRCHRLALAESLLDRGQRDTG
jgi:hypothetical protein